MHLILFFTRGVSLSTWKQVGSLDREVALYEALARAGHRVTFVTYGGPEDMSLADRLPAMRILCNRWRLPSKLYQLGIPLLHGRQLREADVYKTNQTNGARVALRAARLWRKPLVARCGYMWSDSSAFWGEERLAETARARREEGHLFPTADRVVVTTPLMRDYVVSQYAIPSDKIRVIPNYVETDRFRPGGAAPVGNRLCFIGQLGRLKNPLLLVEAAAGLDVELVFVGEGPLRPEIEARGRELGVNVKLLGSQPHCELPSILRQSAAFFLPSPHEGHPKALLEAMACGLPVIGANSQGIREVIRHGENGLLCESTPESARAAIRTLLADAELRSRLGQEARRFALENFALERVVELELGVLQEVARCGGERKGGLDAK